MRKTILYILSGLLYIVSIIIFPPTVTAAFIKYNNSAVFSVSDFGNWDNLQVYGPTILIENGVYKMFYSGSDGTKRQIGYAESILPFNFTRMTSNPLFAWNSINSDDIGVEHPSVLKQEVYKTWFNNVLNNFNNFELYYSYSNDGLNWNKPSILKFDSLATSWDYRGSGAPSVLYNPNQNLYQLWYVAFGNYDGTTRWRIGYATSADGLNWTKHPDPVLWAQDQWEGWDVANPSVLFDEINGTYEMFYHGDHGIGRATSPDGISWTKDPANPILTSTPGTFDSERVFNPYVLKKNGVYYMWYTGVNNQGKWQIGLATSEPIPTPLLTATPPNTPTPTPATATPTLLPTATPASTPSPIPTPAQIFSPVVFVPGLGASWNPQDIFSCSIDSTGNWELAPYISIYNRLIKTLTDNAGLRLNRDFYVYTYDWRQPLDKQSDNFKKYLDKILKSHPSYTKFRLIGHSLGGLVIRSYLSNHPGAQNIASALTIGTPHLGAVESYPVWEKGEISSDDFILQIAMTQIVNHCRVIRTLIPPKNKSMPVMKFRTSREIIRYLTPVIKELLPVFDYLKQDNQIKPVSELVEKNDWLPDHPFPADNFGVDFRTLSGDGKPTLRFYDVVNPTLRETVLGDWADGKPIASEKINEGDGTVLTQSSQLNTVNNEIINGDHGDIVASTAGIQKILHFLGLDGVAPAAMMVIPEETSQTILSISADTDAKLNLTDPRGKIIGARKNIVVSFDPAAGLYRLEISAAKDVISYLHLSRITRGNEAETKSFVLSLTSGKPSRFYLIYNPRTPEPINLIPF